MLDTYPDPPATCDALYATICAAPERGMAASLRWARSTGFGMAPLLLVGWRVGQLSPGMWVETEVDLRDDARSMRARYGEPHVWVEGAALASQAESVMGVVVHSMPEHVVSPSYWDNLVLSTTFRLRSGQVKMTRDAFEQSKQVPFGGLTFRGGPRGDDPTVPAFLYGVVLGLDEQAARPPRPTKVELKVRSGNNRQ